MKNTRILTPPLLQPAKSDTTRRVNLRQHNDCLIAAGEPETRWKLRFGETLAGCDRRGETTFVLTVRDRQLLLAAAIEGSSARAVDRPLCTLEGDVAGMAASGEFLAVADSRRIILLRYTDDDYTLLDSEIRFPVFSWQAMPLGSVTADIPSFSLKGSYPNWTGTVNADDKADIRHLLNDAVSSLRRDAGRNRGYLMPVAVRTALRLADDSLLWCNEWPLLGTRPEIETLARTHPDNRNQIEPSSLSVPLWRPAFTVADAGLGNWRPLVKAIEFYVTDELPLTTGDIRAFLEKRQVGTPEYFIRLSGLTPIGNTEDHSVITQTRGRRVAVISDIDAFLQGKVTGDGIAPTSSPDCFALLSPTTEESAEWQRRLPPFAARTLCDVGGELFCGDLLTGFHRPGAFLSFCDAGQLTDGPAETTVIAEIATTEGISRLVRTETATRYSLTLGRLLVYPDNRALRLTLTAVKDGHKYTLSVPLTASVSGNFAYALAEDEPFQLSADASAVIPEPDERPRHDASAIVRSAAGNPLQWHFCTRSTNRGVIALQPSFRYGSSWLVGRSPVCLFAADGVYLLSFDNRGGFTAATRISRRQLKAPGTVTATENGLAFIDTNGELCLYEGSRVKPTGIFQPGTTSMGYSTRYGEIWLTAAESALIVERTLHCYRRPLPNARINGGWLLADGALSLTESESDTPVSIELTTHPTDIGWQRPELVTWDIASDNADLSLTVYVENGHSCHGRRLSSLHVGGRIGSPIHHRLLAPPTRTLRLSVEGRALPGSCIYPIRIATSR